MEGDYNIHIHTNTATHYFPYNKCTCDHSCIDDCITSLVPPGVFRELCMTSMLYVFQHFAFTGPIPYSASLQLTSCLSPVPFLVPILVWTISQNLIILLCRIHLEASSRTALVSIATPPATRSTPLASLDELSPHDRNNLQMQTVPEIRPRPLADSLLHTRAPHTSKSS